MFKFNGKTYKIVQDKRTKLVDGCNKCAFYDDPDACVNVDGKGTDRETDCSYGYHHYEEVPTL